MQKHVFSIIYLGGEISHMKNIQKYQLAWKQKPLNEKHDF